MAISKLPRNERGIQSSRALFDLCLQGMQWHQVWYYKIILQDQNGVDSVPSWINPKPILY